MRPGCIDVKAPKSVFINFDTLALPDFGTLELSGVLDATDYQ